MKKIILLIFFQVFLISTGFGCGCGREKFSQKAYDKYELIFIGRLIEDDFYQKENYQALAFEVIEVLKGQTTKIVKGRNTAENCSLSFSKGQEWIIYSIPEYGLVNDQFACGLSTLLKDEFGEAVIGQPDHLSKEKWQYELSFLKERKSKKDKLVGFQLVKMVPLLQASILIIAFAGFIIVSEKIKFYRPSILPASLVAGSIGAIFLYFIILPEQSEFKIPLMIVTLLSFLSLANLIYKRWHRGLLTYIRSFVLCYLTYIVMIAIAVPLVIYNRPPSIYGEPPTDPLSIIQDVVVFLSFGLPFSLVLALFYSDIYKRWTNKSSI